MDRYIDSLIAIREEIVEIGEGTLDPEIMKSAPHTLAVLLGNSGGKESSGWARPYPRERAGWPKPWCYTPQKVWPSVGRIDDSYGDRNLFCTCSPPMSTSPQQEVHNQ